MILSRTVGFEQVSESIWRGYVTGGYGDELGETIVHSLRPESADMRHARQFLAAAGGIAESDVDHAAHLAEIRALIAASRAA